MLDAFYTWVVMGALIFIAFIVALAIFEHKKRVGYWVKLGYRDDAYECTLCNSVAPKRTKYCPGCGHPMKKYKEGKNHGQVKR